jgi:multidrug efflux pump subunit AcrB
MRVSVADVNEFGGGQPTARIQYLLVSGPDLDASTFGPAVLARLRQIPGAVDVDTSLVVGKPEMGITVDREKAADLGVQVADVRLGAAAAGRRAEGLHLLRGRRAVRGAPARQRRVPHRRGQAAAAHRPLRKLGLVPLSDVVSVHRAASASTIERYQRERQVTFMGQRRARLQRGRHRPGDGRALKAEALPKGFSIKPQGQTKMMAETGRSFVLGLLAAMCSVPDPRGAVRVVAAPGDHPALAAADPCPSRWPR